MTFIPIVAAIAFAASPAPVIAQADPAAHAEHQQHQAQQPQTTKAQLPTEASSKPGMAEMHGKMGADCHCCCCEAMMGKHDAKEAPASAEEHEHEKR